MQSQRRRDKWKCKANLNDIFNGGKCNFTTKEERKCSGANEQDVSQVVKTHNLTLCKWV